MLVEQSERTPTGHRRYELAQLRGLKPYETSKNNRPTLCYARVASHDQKEDLVRQVHLLETFCAANGWPQRLYGSRNHKNRKLIESLREAAEQL